MNLLLVIIGIYSSVALAAGDSEERLDQMAKQLVQLRGEVDALAQTASSEQRQLDAETDSWRQRWQDMQKSLQNEQVLKGQISARRIALTQVITPESAQRRQELMQVAERLMGHVQAALPYQIDKRSERIRIWQKKAIDPTYSIVALEKDLWAIMQKELNLSRSNEYALTSLALNGIESSFEVARIGSLAMVFANEKGQVGYFEKNQNAWTPVLVQSQTQKDSIRRTLKRFQAQNKVGWFEVPGLDFASLKEAQ